jgi:LuxR family quorum sensing-dependent transcriptional regulator
LGLDRAARYEFVMSGHPTGFVEEAFDLMDRIEAMTTPDAIQRALLEIVGQFGFTYLMMSRLPAEKTRLAPNMLVRVWPEDFLARYDRKNYLRDDPMAAHCFTTLNPFLWSEVGYDRSRQPRAALVMDEAGDAGLREGLSLPVHDKNGFQACISMAGDRIELPARGRRTLHLACHTQGAVAEKIGVAATTVETHLLRAREKLGTVNTVHTVVEALRHRQISL